MSNALSKSYSITWARNIRELSIEMNLHLHLEQICYDLVIRYSLFDGYWVPTNNESETRTRGLVIRHLMTRYQSFTFRTNML